MVPQNNWDLRPNAKHVNQGNIVQLMVSIKHLATVLQVTSANKTHLSVNLQTESLVSIFGLTYFSER